jgi:signal transduction histidine kinase
MHVNRAAINNEDRLKELYNLDILDTPYEEEFNQLVELASKICNTPISTISLIDKERQWLKAHQGIDFRETPLEDSFCAYAITTNTSFYEVTDTFTNSTFNNHPLVKGEPNIRYYAGVPLTTKKGIKLGTLCVIDKKPNKLSDLQIFALNTLAQQAMKLIESKLLSKELTEIKKRQEKQIQLQNKIISIIAHDIRNPVATIKNILQLRKENVLNEQEVEQLTGMAEKQVDATLFLINDLISWGKLQLSAQEENSFETIGLKKMVDDVLNLFVQEAALKNNLLINNIHPSLIINSNKTALSLVLRNIISNCNKFTTAGTITTAANSSSDGVTLTIQDTGVGMSKEKVNQLMQDVYLENNNTTLGTNKEQGSGLGLLFTKEFIHLLKGKLAIESELNKGTKFFITLKKQ